MEIRSIATAGFAVLTALALSGCVSANTETAPAPSDDASTREASCQIVVTELAEYTPELAESAAGLSDYSPSVRLSFQKGAVEELTTVSDKVEHEGVKDALLAVRDSSAALVPILEKLAADPTTWTDGSLDADIAAANEAATTALTHLEEECPGVTQVAS